MTPWLVDTNVLVYRFDARFPAKQKRAEAVLREGVATERLRVPHQALIEMVAALTRRRGTELPILATNEALREAEDLLLQTEVLYPSAEVFRTALRGMATYQLAWFDAHLWAYAEVHGIPELLSEDFEHDRIYGSVRVLNPFVGL